MTDTPGDDFSGGRALGARTCASVLFLPGMLRGTSLALHPEHGNSLDVAAVRVVRLPSFGIEALRDPIFHFVGVAQDVPRIETQNVAEVVDASHIAIRDAGFDDVFEFSAENVAPKHAFDRGGA